MPILIKGSGGAQKVPEISVSSSGLITATAGTKSATKQLSSSMDSDFVASNIKTGTTIFGLTGALAQIVSENIRVTPDYFGTAKVVLDFDPDINFYEAAATLTITTSKPIRKLHGISLSLYKDTADDTCDVYWCISSNVFGDSISMNGVGYLYNNDVYERNENSGVIETDSAASDDEITISGNTVTITLYNTYVFREYVSNRGSIEWPSDSDGEEWKANGSIFYEPN